MISNINSININLYKNENIHLPEQKNKQEQIKQLQHINSYYLYALFNDIYAYIKHINILALQSII